MSTYVVDASVVAKWLVPEVHSAHALRLLKHVNQLLVPDFMFVEVGNIMWKKVRRGELTPVEGRERIRSLAVVPLTVIRAEDVLPAAYEFAVELDRTVYDCLYLAMAIQGQVQMVTADLRYHHTISASRYSGASLWIEDIPSR